MESPDRRATLVWDLPTRLFHWSLVLLVALNLFAISPRGGSSTVIHFVAGYAIAGLLAFRLVWGLIGSRHSRFSDFVRPWPRLREYLGRLMRFDPPHSTGHNPVGGWMILALLFFLLLMIVTGLCAANRRVAGPLASWLGAGAAGLAGELHSLLSSLLIGLIIVHIAGVLGEWLLTGENLIRAMVTGLKRLPAAEAASEPPPAPSWRAAVLGILALAFVLWLSLITDYGQTQATLAPSGGQSSQSGATTP
jgi:cytochrome b